MGRQDAETETLIPVAKARGGFFDGPVGVYGCGHLAYFRRGTEDLAITCECERGSTIITYFKEYGGTLENPHGGIAHTLKGEGHDASEDGTGRGVPLVPAIAPYLTSTYGKQPDNSDTSAGPMLIPMTLPADMSGTQRGYGVDKTGALRTGGSMPVCFDTTQITSKDNYSNPKQGDPCHPLAAGVHPPAIAGMAVRRLTPRECERLQGFPDDWTLVPNGKGTMADGPRYKMCGNSMAVPVMRWIGERINLVEKIINEKENTCPNKPPRPRPRK